MQKTLKWGYISQLLNSGINLLILPFVLYYLSPNQVGMWYNFAMLSGLVLLLDFGFSTTITRNFAYAWSGSSEIMKEGRAEAISQSPNMKLLSALIISSKRIYTKIAIVSLLLLSLFGTFYIYKISDSNIEFQGYLFSWILYLISICINISFLYWTPLLRGVGGIEYFYKANLFSKLMQLILTILFLYNGFELMGISTAYLFSIIFNRLLSATYFKIYMTKNDLFKLPNVDNAYVKNVFEKSFPSVIKQGILSISNYLLDKVMLMYVSLYGGLAASASYGLTIQAFSVITILANVYYNSLAPKIIFNKNKGMFDKAYRLLCKCLKVQVLLVFLGSMALIIIGPSLLALINSNSLFLGVKEMGIIACIVLIYNFQLVCVNYIVMDNIYPMLKGYVFSAISVPLSIIIMSNIIEIKIIDILLIQLLVICIYNFWKWPIYVAKNSGKSISSFIIDVFRTRRI